jgi:hypothetical protein
LACVFCILLSISSYDEGGFRNLQEFLRHSFLSNANVHLVQFDDARSFIAFMTNLLPMFTNINSINIGDADIMRLLQNESKPLDKYVNFYFHF